MDAPLIDDPFRAELPSLADVDALRSPPTTARGIRTRNVIVAAARTVFERDGYAVTRLADIVAEAGCSTGTFYLYFASKDEVFQAVLDAVRGDMLSPEFIGPADASDPRAGLENSIRGYLDSYRRNARFMSLLEQVSTFDPHFRARRIERSRAFAERNARGIAALQARGLADAALDPYHTAAALSSMVSRLAFHAFCMTAGTRSALSDHEVDIEDLTLICTTLWLRGLGVAQ